MYDLYILKIYRQVLKLSVDSFFFILNDFYLYVKEKKTVDFLNGVAKGVGKKRLKRAEILEIGVGLLYTYRSALYLST